MRWFAWAQDSKLSTIGTDTTCLFLTVNTTGIASPWALAVQVPLFIHATNQ